MPKAKAKAPGHTEAQTVAQLHDAAKLWGVSLTRRNVGMALNPAGKPVRFGEVGESDFTFVVPRGTGETPGPNAGRHVFIEAKRGGFDPTKLRGKDAAHFARQLEYLRRRNAEGGVATWLSDGEQFARLLQRLHDWPGLRVEFDARGYPHMTDEPEGAR